MSVIQSKENIRGGKLSRYYGRLAGGDMCSHIGEMSRLRWSGESDQMTKV